MSPDPTSAESRGRGQHHVDRGHNAVGVAALRTYSALELGEKASLHARHLDKKVGSELVLLQLFS